MSTELVLPPAHSVPSAEQTFNPQAPSPAITPIAVNQKIASLQDSLKRDPVSTTQATSKDKPLWLLSPLRWPVWIKQQEPENLFIFPRCLPKPTSALQAGSEISLSVFVLVIRCTKGTRACGGEQAQKQTSDRQLYVCKCFQMSGSTSPCITKQQGSEFIPPTFLLPNVIMIMKENIKRAWTSRHRN